MQMIFVLWQNSRCHHNIMAMRFDLLLETHWEPSRAPRNSKLGTDFPKNPLCSYTKTRIASCRNREVIRGGASANSTETDHTSVPDKAVWIDTLWLEFIVWVVSDTAVEVSVWLAASCLFWTLLNINKLSAAKIIVSLLPFPSISSFPFLV